MSWPGVGRGVADVDLEGTEVDLAAATVEPEVVAQMAEVRERVASEPAAGWRVM